MGSTRHGSTRTTAAWDSRRSSSVRSAPQARIAVAIPTSTWGAYNFYDADRDGWGDTWYARWKTRHADLARPHATRGVPYRYRSYDLAFQHWLAQTGKTVDTYADEDLEVFASPEALRASYDLIVFPGHTEYVTAKLYDLVEGFRDLGGNLLFLSANNFFRRVDRHDHVLTLIDEWRDLGRPEAALLGNQYLASDRGQKRAPFTVVGADLAPWALREPDWATTPPSVSTGSRSTRAARPHHPRPRFSRPFRICSGRAGPPR